MRVETAPAGMEPGQLASPALVGREAELDQLLEALTGPPAVVVVEGEAGVGKTRLVAEVLLAPELRGRRTLIGSCQPFREPLPFGPVIEALRGVEGKRFAHEPGAIAGALRPLLPELSEQLPPALEPLGDQRAERHRLFRRSSRCSARSVRPSACSRTCTGAAGEDGPIAVPCRRYTKLL